MVDLAQMFGAGEAEGFLGWARVGSAEGADIAVLGADTATPYASVGPYCAGGPAAIRAGALTFSEGTDRMNFDLGGPVLPAGVTAVDLGDVAVDTADAPGNRAAIRAAVAGVRQAGAVPIVLGGDDSVPIPMLEALAGDGPITVLQVDAHIDWRDSVAGERWGLSSTMRRASEMDHVERIVQVGVRGMGSAGAQEYSDALDWGAEFVFGREIARDGVQRAIEAVPKGARVAIAFDCDALDPAAMPAVIGRTAGGLSYAQALDLIEGVAARAEIVAFDLVEFMPARDVDDIGAMTAAQLVAAVAGMIARQRVADA
ncbi:MAG: arginase family protein [Pseudomonadota bacterium]